MRGFSLVELAVVLVVVAAIASIAVPTYRTVMRRAQTQVAERSLATVVSEAWVLAAYDNDVHYSVGRLSDAAADTSTGGDPWTVDATEGAVSGAHGEIAVALEDDGNAVAAAMRDSDGGCSYLLAWRSEGPQLWSVPAEAGSECSAAEALFGAPGDDGPYVTVP